MDIRISLNNDHSMIGGNAVEYRRLGKSGLKVSALSLGAWVTYGGQVGEEIAEQCMSAAREHLGFGVNFFDNAEACSGIQEIREIRFKSQRTFLRCVGDQVGEDAEQCMSAARAWCELF
jgi:hypothetical protein